MRDAQDSPKETQKKEEIVMIRGP